MKTLTSAGAEEVVLDSSVLDSLKSLHTGAIDARNGYKEALDEAGGKGVTHLFRDMIDLHDGHAGELARELIKANEIPDETGSFMTVVHKTIMDVRSLFNGLDESVLPGLIDGEKRNIAKYDEAIKVAKAPSNVAGMLIQHRDGILQEIARMQAQKAASERVA